MKKTALILLTVLILSGCNTTDTSLRTDKVKINDTSINVKIVKTATQKAQGLSGKESLAPNDGMLFIFEKSETPMFWMKDMNFPLDIIWILDDIIVDISKNVPVYTNGEITRVKAEKANNHVLEVNAGFTDKNSIRIGDQITLIK